MSTSTTSFFQHVYFIPSGKEAKLKLAFLLILCLLHDCDLYSQFSRVLWLAHVPPVECTPGKPTGYQAPMKMFSWIYSPVEVHIQPCLVLLCALQRCLTGVNMQGAAALSLFCQRSAAPGRSVSSSFHRLLLHYHMPPISSGRGPAYFTSLSQFNHDHTGFLSTD